MEASTRFKQTATGYIATSASSPNTPTGFVPSRWTRRGAKNVLQSRGERFGALEVAESSLLYGIRA